MSSKSLIPSGAGARPTTDGTVDNIGAGSGFDPAHPNSNGPMPHQKMAEKRADAASVAQDDSAPFGLHDDARPSTSEDPSQRSSVSTDTANVAGKGPGPGDASGHEMAGS
jgi:hypothetical protein